MTINNFTDIKISDGVSTVAFDVIAHVEDSDYSWSAEAVLKRKADGALFYVEDGGCSCNSFGEYLSVADLKPIQRVEDAYALTSDRVRLKKSYEQGEVEYR